MTLIIRMDKIHIVLFSHLDRGLRNSEIWFGIEISETELRRTELFLEFR